MSARDAKELTCPGHLMLRGYIDTARLALVF
jgi:hypothetical protein